jgi:proline iminopeptidase
MLTELNGCQIYYEVHGKEDGDPIFFIHGGPGLGDCRGDVLTFAPLGEEYKLVFLDMRGSGRSADIPPFTHAQWADDIEALRQQLGFGKIAIHGSSYGGFISQEYALRYPDSISHVFLNVTAANNEHHYMAIKNALNSNLPGINKGMLERLFNGEVASNEEFKEMYGAILPLYAVEYDPEVGKAKLDAIFYHYATHNAAFHENLSQYDLRDRLNEIKVPTLITAGRLDWIVPAVYSEEMARKIPGSKLVVFEKNGHSLVRERSEEYLTLLKDFLTKEEVKHVG